MALTASAAAETVSVLVTDKLRALIYIFISPSNGSKKNKK